MIPRLWVVIPAAGSGRRLSSEIPKQYLRLAERSVLEWSLAPFLARTDIAGIGIALASGDEYFRTLPIAQDARIRLAVGGAERADSVLSAVETLSADNSAENNGAKDQDWILVHDAARPCLHVDDLKRLIAELQDDEVGGLLAAQVTDTLKSDDASCRVRATVPRANLWRALTPQMFRFGLLLRALRNAVGKGITDESGAIELLGLKPRLVEGRSDNIKVTRSEDLPNAEAILRQRLAK